MVTPVTADTNRVSLFIAQEADDSWGETPGSGVLAPKMYEVRMTGESIVHEKETVVSEVIRSDRMRDTLSEVAALASGDINYELVFRDMDVLLETVFADQSLFILEKTFAAGDVSAIAATNEYDGTAGTFTEFVDGAEVWVSGFLANADNNGRFIITNVTAGDLVVDTAALGGSDLTDETPAGTTIFKSNKVRSDADLVVGTTSTFTTTTLDFTTLNLVVGQFFGTSGFVDSANNAVYEISAIAASTLTVVGTPLVTESAPATSAISAKRLKNGVGRKSLLVEKSFVDVAEFGSWRGMRAGTMSLTAESGSIVTGTISFTGKEGVPAAASVAGSTIAAGVTDALNATTNLGSIEEGGALLTTALQSLEMEIANNLREKPQIGSKSPVDVGYGFIDVTGTITAYFEDRVLWEKFVNHTASSLKFRLTDSNNNAMHFTIPRIFFSDGNPTAPGGNDDVLVPLEWTAVRDTVTSAVIIIDIIEN